MKATIKSTKRINQAKTLPRLPEFSPPKHTNEVQEIEGYIRSLGGKPLSKGAKQRLIAAGCYGWPAD